MKKIDKILTSLLNGFMKTEKYYIYCKYITIHNKIIDELMNRYITQINSQIVNNSLKLAEQLDRFVGINSDINWIK